MSIQIQIQQQGSGNWTCSGTVPNIGDISFEDTNLSYVSQRMVNFLKDRNINPFTKCTWPNPKFYTAQNDLI
jgi:hypothetical protein